MNDLRQQLLTEIGNDPSMKSKIEDMLCEELPKAFAHELSLEGIPIGSPRELKIEWPADAAQDLAKLFSIE